MVRSQPEPSRNTVVAVAIVASVTHTAQAVLGGERGRNTASILSGTFIALIIFRAKTSLPALIPVYID
jgi:hypothetical protein